MSVGAVGIVEMIMQNAKLGMLDGRGRRLDDPRSSAKQHRAKATVESRALLIQPSPVGEGFFRFSSRKDATFFRRGGVSPPVFALQSNVFGKGDPSPTVSIGRGRRLDDPMYI